MKEFVFYRNTKSRCDFEKESDVIDQMESQAELSDFDEFDAHCQYESIAEELGYDADLSLKDDWHVGYLKSKFGGLPCFVLDHSECKFIFLRPHDAEMLQEYHGKDAVGVNDLQWKRHTQFGKSGIDP